MAIHRSTPKGPFSLRTSARFFCGFTPASGTSCATEDGSLTIGFLSDAFEPVVARVSEDLSIEAPSAAVAHQIERILSLDTDGTPMVDIARRDKTIATLLEKRPGFRPICFPSAYEAAVWGVLSQRVRMSDASTMKRTLSERTGSRVEGFGRTFHPSPRPKQLLAIKNGVHEEKLARLHGIARAALDGKLDTESLQSMPEQEALEELEKLRGIGHWTSRHILYRGCGATDALPTMEPRVLRGIGAAYGLKRVATISDAERLSNAWRPLRMWISVLLVANLADQSARISQPRSARRSTAKPNMPASADAALP